MTRQQRKNVDARNQFAFLILQELGRCSLCLTRPCSLACGNRAKLVLDDDGTIGEASTFFILSGSEISVTRDLAIDHRLVR